MQTYVFISCVTLSTTKTFLELQKESRLFGKVFFLFLTAGAGPGAGPEELSRFWIPNSGFGPNFKICPRPMQNHFWGFFSLLTKNRSLVKEKLCKPNKKKNIIYIYIYICIFPTDFPPSFTAVVIPLRDSLLDITQCSRARYN